MPLDYEKPTGLSREKLFFLFLTAPSIQRRSILSKEKETKEIRSLDEHVKQLQKEVDQRLAELKVQLDDIQQKASKTVIRRPMLALSVAFVTGMAVGVALSKSND
jgi:ElaB/YqjD/DUF883 family membrane-anchored ribosome-binding protein